MPFFNVILMIIEIHDTKTIQQIRDEFSHFYPFLDLAFYKESHKIQEPSSGQNQYAPSKTIGEIRKKHNPGMLEIHPGQKTGILELEFHRHYGLNVQVLRHHGNAWIQTAGTDDLTLQEQNEIGRNTSEDSEHAEGRRIENEKLI